MQVMKPAQPFEEVGTDLTGRLVIDPLI